MVCRNHFKSTYTRFLIKYHLIIFFSLFTMTNLAIGLVIYKYDQIHFRNLLKGFIVHGTKTSDDYRKLIALIRETQVTHLFPHTYVSETYEHMPYGYFSPNRNLCTNRFYLSTCPIVPYTELTFSLKDNLTNLFDNLELFQSICQFELNFQSRFSNCSQGFCCDFIGPVGLLFHGQLETSEQCQQITINQLESFRLQWFSCQTSSSCENQFLHTYRNHDKLSSSITWKIFLNLGNNSDNLIYLYENLQNYQYENHFYLLNMKFNFNDEQIIFIYLLNQNRWLIILSLIFYIFCLLLFVKNIFFLIIIIQQIFLTLFLTFILYIYFFQFPLTILNYTSLILYLFIILIDSFLWYTCWFVNNHRRDDCTINRIIENLLTQTFYYILPKNLTACLVLIITYTNQIIALQCFTVFAFLLIFISFFISFILYPVSFTLILRYKSSIPTIEHYLHGCCRNYFIDRTIAYLIVRLKAFWLTFLILIACLSFIIIFQWPKLQFDVCQLIFEIFPTNIKHSSLTNQSQIKSLDIDITYYIGSQWEVPNEGMIPSRDIPLLDYISENRMSSTPGGKYTFQYALEKNLSQLIEFCTQLKIILNHNKRLTYRHYSRQIQSYNQTLYQALFNNQFLTVKQFDCFGDLSPSEFLSSDLLSTSKFHSLITNSFNQSSDCKQICSFDTNKCIACLNSLFYNSKKFNDLFLIKNGLRFLNDAQYPRYLFQTIKYHWQILTNLNNYFEWKFLIEYLKENLFAQFYSQTFTHMSFWYSSEIFSTYTILEQLEQEKYLLTGMKFVLILIFLVLFTGVLGIFVTLTTLCNFLTCIAVLTLMNYKLTIENLAYFTIILIICSQYSSLYSISYKLAPTFFFQRENRTMYSLKQLCTTLFHLTFSIIFITMPCFCSSIPYLHKIFVIYSLTSIISLFYSTFFLQSLLCYIGPADQTCLFFPIRLKFKRHLHPNSHDQSMRKSSTISRRHQRMSTSSYFQSSYFSQILTGSTYFESEYGGINETIMNATRRKESSRSHQLTNIFKRNSLFTGELIELYSPRASLAPYGHHTHHRRYSRQLSVSRPVPSTTPTRPLYISPSISPFSQISIHSQGAIRQRSPSPQISRQSRSPSPHSYSHLNSASSLRPCYSAPRLHATMQRPQTINLPTIPIQTRKKSVTIIQRQDAISSSVDHQEQISAEIKRHNLKSTATLWIKRSNSS